LKIWALPKRRFWSLRYGVGSSSSSICNLCWFCWFFCHTRDRHRTPGSREEVPTHQRLSRNPIAEGALEPLAYSAEGGADSRSCL